MEITIWWNEASWSKSWRRCVETQIGRILYMYIENFLNWRGEGGVIDFQSF